MNCRTALTSKETVMTTRRLSTAGMLGATLLMVTFAGCAKSAGVIFGPLPKPIFWPAPPEKPRIAYVGQLLTDADLKPAVPFGKGFGEAIFGKTPTRSMLTPYAVCTDGKSRLFVADSNAQLVHVFNLDNRKYEQWKPPEKSPPFSQPVGIAWDPAGILFVADSVGGRIVSFETSGMARLPERVAASARSATSNDSARQARAIGDRHCQSGGIDQLGGGGTRQKDLRPLRR